MYRTAAKVKKLTYFSHLNKSFKSDLYWWHMFINHRNGISLLRSATTFPDYHIYTDASGSWGFGTIFASFWFQLPWPMEWSSINIMAKEYCLTPLLISTYTQGLSSPQSKRPPDQPITTELRHKAVQFLANGLATYAAGQQRFTAFCQTINASPIPATEHTLLLFATQLATSNIAQGLHVRQPTHACVSRTTRTI